MRILVNWHTGTRNRSDFRMLLDSCTVEKRALNMLGEEQWVSVNLQPKDIETVRNQAINALAVTVVNAWQPDTAKRVVNAMINGGTACDLVIDLGCVVMS